MGLPGGFLEVSGDFGRFLEVVTIPHDVFGLYTGLWAGGIGSRV